MDTHSLRKFNNLNVWVYDTLTLELIDSFSSMQKAADYFNVDYRSLLKHLDTKLATNKKSIIILVFSKELTSPPIRGDESLKSVNKVTNETTPIWVYKIVGGELILINSNKPTYNSKYSASKDLNISNKTISKYLNSDKNYKGYYFYSTLKK